MDQTIGIYKLLNKIKAEKHFSVYVAFHPHRNELVKLKVFTSPKSRDPLFFDNLRKAYQIQERLAHPGLEKPAEVFLHNGYPTIASPFEKGDYFDRLLQTKKIDLKKALQVLKEVGHILLFLEKEGLIHGSISPASIYVSEDGQVKLENMGVVPLLEGGGQDEDIKNFYNTVSTVLTAPFASLEEKEKARTLFQSLSPPYSRTQDLMKALQEDSPYSFEPLPLSSPVKEKSVSKKPLLASKKSPAPRSTRQLLTCSGLILVAFFMVIILAFGFSHLFSPALPDVHIPKLIAQPFEQAQKTASKRGLKLRVRGYQFHPTIPKENIISQDPNPGSIVKKGRTITVVLSQGPAKIVMPHLVGKTLDQGKALLQQLALTFETQTVEDPDKPEATILEQHPVEGAKVEKGSRVYLRVSKKPKEVLLSMPNLIGETLTKARQEIASLKLKISSIRHVPSDKPEGTVLSQTPSPEEKIKEEALVKLEVSQGKPKETTPPPPSKVLPLQKATVDVVIPEENPSQLVEIIVKDQEGKHVFYKKKHSGGEKVSIPVQGRGKSEVLVYLDGKLVRQESL